MIRVTLELVSARGRHRDKTLGRAIITNKGVLYEGLKKGDYDIMLSTQRVRLWRAATITEFPRLRLNAWDLLYRLLRETVGNRNEMKSSAHYETEKTTGQDATSLLLQKAREEERAACLEIVEPFAQVNGKRATNAQQAARAIYELIKARGESK